MLATNLRVRWLRLTACMLVRAGTSPRICRDLQYLGFDGPNPRVLDEPLSALKTRAWDSHELCSDGIDHFVENPRMVFAVNQDKPFPGCFVSSNGFYSDAKYNLVPEMKLPSIILIVIS